MKDIENRIQQLLEHKNFADLSGAEQEMVFSLYTEEEYSNMRKVLSVFAEQVETEQDLIVPNLDISKDLKERLREKNRNKKVGILAVIASFFSYRLPAYQLALAMVAFLFGAFYFLKPATISTADIEPEIVYETVRDTVYVNRTKEIPVIKEVRIVEQVKVKEPIVELQTKYEAAELGHQVSESTVPDFNEISKSFGNSNVESDVLERFRVSM